MEMSGQQLILATKEEVWAALIDPDVLKVCIPGCQELKKSSETEMSAVAVMKVGPVKAKFQGAVTLSDLDPPHGYKITGEGQGGVAGFAKGTALVKLSQAEGGTVLDYTVDAQIGGKLSQLGGRLIDVTARQMAGQFFKRFAEEIRNRQNPSAVVDSSEAEEEARPAPHQAQARSLRAMAPATAAGPHAHTVVSATSSAISLAVLAVVVFVSVLAALWLFHGLLMPTVSPPSDMPGRVAPDIGILVQLIMAGAIGYLLGKAAT